MARIGRNLRILLVAVVVIALVLGVTFQLATERALDHAEAFRWRRMLVTQQDPGAYRFFYATNRRLIDAEAPRGERFASERGEALHFGRFDTTIEPSLGIGVLIDPTDWFRNEEIRIRDLSALDEAGFVRELRDQVERSRHRSLLIKINGFRERFPSALRKTAFVGHVLDIDSPLLVFDWPGDQGSTPRGYRRAQGIARESGRELARLLELVVEEIRPERLWLLANSMGGEVVVEAFGLLHEKPAFADTQPEFEDVVLTAPDVSHEDFGEAFEEEIAALSRDLTVYVSSNDRALLMSRVLNRGRRLGESTVDTANPDQLDEAMVLYEMVEPGSDRVTLVDVTPVNRTRNFHNFSLETPEFFDDLFLRLVNEDAPRSRLRYRIRTPDGRHYWIITRGR